MVLKIPGYKCVHEPLATSQSVYLYSLSRVNIRGAKSCCIEQLVAL